MSDPNSFDGPVVAPADDKRRGLGRNTGERVAATPRVANSGGAGGFPLALIIVLALTIVGGGAMGYVLSEQLGTAQAELVTATERIRRLEEELNITGSTMSESDAKAQEQIEFWETETRKLWDMTKGNRSKIDDTAKDVDAVERSLRTLRTAADNMQASVTRLEKGLATTQALTTQVNDVSGALQDVTRNHRELTDRVNAVDQSSRALKASIDKRIGEQEQAVAAFDSFRRQMNSRINTMANDIAALKGTPAPN